MDKKAIAILICFCIVVGILVYIGVMHGLESVGITLGITGFGTSCAFLHVWRTMSFYWAIRVLLVGLVLLIDGIVIFCIATS